MFYIVQFLFFAVVLSHRCIGSIMEIEIDYRATLQYHVHFQCYSSNSKSGYKRSNCDNLPAFAPTLSLLLVPLPVVGTGCPTSGGVAGVGGPGGLVGDNGGGGVVDALTLVVGNGAGGGGTLAGSYTVASNFMPAVQLVASASTKRYDCGYV